MNRQPYNAVNKHPTSTLRQHIFESQRYSILAIPQFTAIYSSSLDTLPPLTLSPLTYRSSFYTAPNFTAIHFTAPHFTVHVFGEPPMFHLYRPHFTSPHLISHLTLPSLTLLLTASFIASHKQNQCSIRFVHPLCHYLRL